MNLPAWRDWVFAFKVFAAAVLALYLAMWIDLPRPYWALSTVFITLQPLTGGTRARAAYRVYGTVLGAIAAVVLVPNLIDSPELLSLAIALWVGACVYFSLLDRTPRSYVPMLAGYTTAFIAFPAVSVPGSIFDTAVARAEEITLGILCASFVALIVLPQSVVPLIKSRVDQWFRDARSWSAAVLARSPISRSDTQGRRLRLASDVIAFDALVTPLRYDMTGAERSADTMATLRQHMLMFLPIVTSISDRIDTVERLQPLPDKIRQILNDLGAWLASGTTDPLAADQLRLAVANATPVLGRNPSWIDLVISSLAARFRDFIDLRQDARLLRRHIEDGTPVREQLAFRYTARARTIRHRDHGLALLSAAAAALAVLLSCFFWIASGWPDGALAPMMAAVGCSFFAAQDDPAPQIMLLANAALIGVAGAGIYLFAILPLATTFEMLVLALAPGIVACGLLMTQPRTALLGLGIGVVGFTLMALQTSYAGSFTSFANTGVATVIGMWTAAVVTRLVRSVGAAWSARRLEHMNRAALAEAAFQHGAAEGLELAALMLDRIGLIAPRLAAMTHDDAEWASELLTEVRIGIDLVELQRVRRTLSPESAIAIDRTLSMVGNHFLSDAIQADAKLLSCIDESLDTIVVHDEEESGRQAVLLGLTDLRRGLFPNAAPYRVSEPAIINPEAAA
jgi:uncharacterized membrane protein YccC